MSRRFLPGATIGLMGSGQLGRMFAIAARRMGYRVHVYSPDRDTPAGQFSDREVTGAYEDENAVRAFARSEGGWANIPPRRTRKDPICFSPFLYRARNRIERFFNRIKQCRRIATRYDKLAENFRAFVKLAAIRLWVRVNESTP